MTKPNKIYAINPSLFSTACMRMLLLIREKQLQDLTYFVCKLETQQGGWRWLPYNRLFRAFMLALGLGSIWKIDHSSAHKYCITAVSDCIALHNNPKIHPVLRYFVPDKLHFRLFCTENYIEIFAILWQYCYNDFFLILGYVSLLRY